MEWGLGGRWKQVDRPNLMGNVGLTMPLSSETEAFGTVFGIHTRHERLFTVVKWGKKKRQGRGCWNRCLYSHGPSMMALQRKATVLSGKNLSRPGDTNQPCLTSIGLGIHPFVLPKCTNPEYNIPQSLDEKVKAQCSNWESQGHWLAQT